MDKKDHNKQIRSLTEAVNNLYNQKLNEHGGDPGGMDHDHDGMGPHSHPYDAPGFEQEEQPTWPAPPPPKGLYPAGYPFKDGDGMYVDRFGTIWHWNGFEWENTGIQHEIPSDFELHPERDPRPHRRPRDPNWRPQPIGQAPQGGQQQTP